MTAKILNVERLQRKFTALPQVARKMIKEALEQSADEIVAMARNLVPVDDGALRESIGWTWGRVPSGSISLGAVRVGDLSITVYAGNEEAFYARWVEFGTQATAANPFFFVAYRALRKRAKSRISRSITKAAKKVAAS